MHRTLETPLGPLTLVATRRGLRQVLFGAPSTPTTPTTPSTDEPGDAAAVLDQAERELTAYFAGAGRTFEAPLDPAGTPFQRLVWRELARIPFGATCSYAELAARIGRPRAVRAVGAANASNPLAVIVPCHRVIGSDGRLTGYAGGIDRKRWLLDHERAAW